MRFLAKKFQAALVAIGGVLARNAWQGFLSVVPWVLTLWFTFWLYDVLVNFSVFITNPINQILFGEVVLTSGRIPWPTTLTPEAIQAFLPYVVTYVCGPLLALFGLVLLGFLTRRSFVKWLKDWFEAHMKNVPLIGSVFKLVWETAAAVGKTGTEAHFSKVVFIEGFRKGVKLLGFVTHEAVLENGRTLLAVFVPTTPMPNSGQLMFVMDDRKDIICDAPYTVEQAFKSVLSLGIVSPQITEVIDLTEEPEWRKKMEGDLDHLKGSLSDLKTRLGDSEQ